MMPPYPHPRRPAARAQHGGFTLVELLVAIALMAVVSIMAWRGLDSITSLRERLADDAAHTESLLTMLGQLERDIAMRAPDMALQAAISTPLPDGSSRPARALPLALEIERTAGAHAGPRLEIVRADAANAGAWQRVVWWHDGNALRRAAGTPSVTYPLPAPGAGTQVMSDVSAFVVQGWVQGSGWADLPLAPGSNTPITGLEVIVQRGGTENDETYSRVVALQ